MKTKFFFLLITNVAFVCNAFAQFPESNENYVQIMRDDFNGTFDNTTWYYSTQPHESGGTYEGLAYPLINNVFIDDTCLVIRARNDTSISHTNVNCHYGGVHTYTSGSIVSNGKYGYGLYEMYANLPAESGCWPAFWLWSCGEDNNDDWYNEIDIFEAYGNDNDDIESNMHYSPTCGNRIQYGANKHPVLYNNGFHWYGIEWNSDRITWYVDRVAVRQVNNTMEGEGIQHKMKIIINLELQNKETNNIALATFPIFMRVDYVAYYKLLWDCDTDVVEISDYSTFDYAVKKSIRLSGLSSLNVNENASIMATDYIILENGFEVPVGSEFYADVVPCDNDVQN